jgi:hypothetical protein
MNFITKKHLSRRTFIRGTGVTLALPFLESMLPAQTPSKAAGAVPKTRTVLHLLSAWCDHGSLAAGNRRHGL